MVVTSSLIANVFLVFSHAIVISPLLIIGFMTRGGFFIKPPSKEGSTTWGTASLLVLFSMIFNMFLKSLFLIPLNPVLGLKGYAFPSGHMQVAVVFYGWLYLMYPYRVLRVLILCILTGIGYGLVQQGYHNAWDVTGAVGFGLATLYIIKKIISFPTMQRNPTQLSYGLIPTAGLLIGIIILRLGMLPYTLKVFIALVGFSVAWRVLDGVIWKMCKR